MTDTRPPATPGSARGRTSAAPEALSVTTTGDALSVVVAVYGEIDLASVGILDDAVSKALEGDAPQIVVDLGACHFIDSTGLGALVNLQRRVERAEGRELLLLPGPRAVQRAFEVSGLVGVLPFLDGST